MSDDTEVLDTQDEGVAVEAPEAIEQPAERTMDDTIRETLDEITARGEGKEAEQAQERIDKRKLRERGPDGKYLAKPVEDKAAAVQKPVETEQPALEAMPEPAAAPVAVPPELQRLGLRKEEAEAFAKADQVVRDAFIRRSEEMHKGLEQFRSKAQFGDQMAQAVQPFAQTLQGLGIHPAQAVQKLFAADHSLRYGTPEQKQAAIVQIAQQYGVDLGGAQQYQASQPQFDPRIQALEERLQRQDAWIQQQAQAREWQERETLNSEIDRFSKDPANEYFEAVRNDMAGLLQAGLASSLQEAYERAIYANPTVRAQVLAKQQAQAEEQRRAESAKKAAAAKQAAAVNVARKGSMPAAKPIGTMEDTIRQEAERLGLIA